MTGRSNRESNAAFRRNAARVCCQRRQPLEATQEIEAAPAGAGGSDLLLARPCRGCAFAKCPFQRLSPLATRERGFAAGFKFASIHVPLVKLHPVPAKQLAQLRPKVLRSVVLPLLLDVPLHGIDL